MLLSLQSLSGSSCGVPRSWCRVPRADAEFRLLVQRVGVAFAWDSHDRQARPSSFRVGPCTAASSAWRSCCLVFDKENDRYHIVFKVMPGISLDSRPYHALGLGGSAPLRGPGARLSVSRGPRAPVGPRARPRLPNPKFGKGVPLPAPGRARGLRRLAAAGGRAHRPGSPRHRRRWRSTAGARSLAITASQARGGPASG